MPLEYYKVARPYAKAVFEQAKEKNTLDSWLELFQIYQEAIHQPEIQELVITPSVSNPDKVEFFAGFNKAGDIKEDLNNFLTLLAVNKRFAAMGEMADLFFKFYEEHQNRLQVEVLSSMALNDIQLERLKKSLKKRFDKKIEINNQVDKSLLGGIVIKAGNVVFDFSVGTLLKQMVHQLVA